MEKAGTSDFHGLGPGACLKLRKALPFNMHIEMITSNENFFMHAALISFIRAGTYFIVFASVTLSPPGVRPMDLALMPLHASSVLIRGKFCSHMPVSAKQVASTDIS